VDFPPWFSKFQSKGVSKSVYSISHCHFSFLNFFLSKYQASSSSFNQLFVLSNQSFASLLILSAEKFQSSGFDCKYQKSHLAFQEIFSSLKSEFGIIQNLFFIFSLIFLF
jgi:hypothetical protein